MDFAKTMYLLHLVFLLKLSYAGVYFLTDRLVAFDLKFGPFYSRVQYRVSDTVH